MKYRFLILTHFVIILSSCSSQIEKKSLEGEVVSNLDNQTFHAQYKGPHLKVGDRVNIFKYEDFETDLKDRPSRNEPLKKKKVFIGKGVISSVLNDDYYEFKSDTPKHLPEGSVIEKL